MIVSNKVIIVSVVGLELNSRLHYQIRANPMEGVLLSFYRSGKQGRSSLNKVLKII